MENTTYTEARAENADKELDRIAAAKVAFLLQAHAYLTGARPFPSIENSKDIKHALDCIAEIINDFTFDMERELGVVVNQHDDGSDMTGMRYV